MFSYILLDTDSNGDQYAIYIVGQWKSRKRKMETDAENGNGRRKTEMDAENGKGLSAAMRMRAIRMKHIT